MRLWNDYEGTTIAEAYPIEKLLRPEGRSAFFSTSNGTGTPAVIRLIESINDESEILTRWKTVADLKETHLVTLKKFGQTVFEGTPLIYVLMESTEADLSGILRERPLTTEETRQIATSLVEAVQALHASGIVHEHIEPSNVMATGEVVKLRSDCIREAPEGEEGAALKQQDVHDLAVVLLQALTQRKTLDGIDGKSLPAPFDQIIRNGMSGAWGLAQIAATLTPSVKSSLAPNGRAAVSASPAARMAAGAAPAQPIPLAIARATEQTAWSAKRPEPVKAVPEGLAPATPPRPSATPPQPASPRVAAAVPAATAVATKSPVVERDRIVVPVVDEVTKRRRLWLAIAPAVLVVGAALGWHALHKPVPAGQTPPPIATPSDAGQPAATVPAPQPVAPVAVARPAAGDTLHPWRVVAYTYNRRDEAQHKVETIARRDAALRPEVFTSPDGGSFLVTVGGAMTRDEALAMRQKAKAEGLPRDSYIQNYGDREQRHAHRSH